MTLRSAKILFKLAPTILSILRDRRRWLVFGGPRPVSQQMHQRRAANIRGRIETLGPTFIKLAQILSTRADLLPPPYITELSKLQDSVPPDPPEDIRRVIQEDLGRPVHEIFERFDDEALAAASLGQVHRARYQGKEVVVKVLRPGVPDIVHMDIRIVSRILDVLNSLVRHHFLTAFTNIFNEYCRVIEEEMDFVEEANNAERFRDNLKDLPRIIIPKVYRDVSSGRVIVLKYYEGIKISDDAALKRAGINVLRLIEDLIEVYAHMMLVDRFFHADPHPGNFIVIPSVEPAEEKIVILDFGMVIRLDEPTKNKLIRAAAAWAKREIDELVNCLYDLDVIDPETNPAAVIDASRELVDIIDKYKFSQRRIQKYFTAVLDTFYRFPLRMPSNLVYLAKTGIVIEGIGVGHDPNFDGARAATPVIKRMLKTTILDPRASPVEYLAKKLKELHTLALNVERFFHRASRDETRLRFHPADLGEIERFFATTNRRIMAAVFVLAMMIITAILYLRISSGWLLGGGLIGSLIIFLIIYLLPPRPKGRY